MFISDTISIEANGARAIAVKLNSTLQTRFNFWNNCISDEGAKAKADALKVNLMLEKIDIGLNNIAYHLTSQIAEALKLIRSRKEMNYRKLICAFTAYHVDSIVYYSTR